MRTAETRQTPPRLRPIVVATDQATEGSPVQDVERFIQVYEEVWPSFDADRLERFEMVHPEATIDHSGMERPIRGDEEPDYVRFKLRDGRVIEAIGRWDTAAIQAALNV